MLGKLLISTLIVFVSCGNSEDDGSDTNVFEKKDEPIENVSPLNDLSKFVAFATGEESGASLTSTEGGTLYGVDSEGEIEQIKVGENGIHIKRIYNLKKYVIFIPSHTGGTLELEGKPCLQLIFQKDIASLFCLNDVAVQELSDYLAAEFSFVPVQDDDEGNSIVFLGKQVEKLSESGYPNLYRLVIEDKKLSVSTIHQATGYIEEFIVNGSGDVLFKYYGDDTEGRLLGMSTLDGESIPMGSGDYEDCLTYGIGDDSLNFYSHGSTAGMDTHLESMTKDGESSRKEAFATPGNFLKDSNQVEGDFDCDIPVRHTNGLFFATGLEERDDDNTPHMTMIEYDSEKPEGSIHYLSAKMAYVERAVSDKKYIYMVGTTKRYLGHSGENKGDSLVLRFNTETAEVDELVPPGLFKVGHRDFHIRSNGKLKFYAQRVSDNGPVSVEIDPESPVSAESDAETSNIKLENVDRFISLED